MSIVPSASTRLVPVPIPDSVAALIGSCMPIHVLQAEIDVDAEARELSQSRIRIANKALAAYNPGLILTPKRGAA